MRTYTFPSYIYEFVLSVHSLNSLTRNGMPFEPRPKYKRAAFNLLSLPYSKIETGAYLSRPAANLITKTGIKYPGTSLNYTNTSTGQIAQ